MDSEPAPYGVELGAQLYHSGWKASEDDHLEGVFVTM